MGRLPIGPATSVNHTSHGGEYDIQSVYHTRYNNEYGNGAFKPRPGRPSGSGYASNLRPQIFYKRSMDEHDNPFLAQLLAGNYESITRRHYKDTIQGADGKDALPGNAYANGNASGFTEQIPLSIPTRKQVRDVHFDTRTYGGDLHPGIRPKFQIHLQKIQSKDAVERMNHNHGAAYMKSEMETRYLGKQHAPLEIHQKDVGGNEVSGAVHNINIEPITYQEKDAYRNDRPGEMTNRPTGISLTTENYRGWKDQIGRELFPTVTNLSNQSNAYVKHGGKLRVLTKQKDGYNALEECPTLRANNVKKNDPAEFMNLKYAAKKKSTMKAQYLGMQRHPPVEEEILKKDGVGRKEFSGECWNNVRYEPTRNVGWPTYLTTYNARHYNPNPTGINRMGWTMGGTHQSKRDGFTHNNGVHTYGRNKDLSNHLERLAPHVARTVKRDDRFFGEQIHSHKAAADSHYHYTQVYPLHTATNMQIKC